MEIRFLSNIIDYDPITTILTLKLNFVDPFREGIIEDLIEKKGALTFWFSKPFRREKTWEQLKMYFWSIKRILVSQEIRPTSNNVKTLDVHFKKTLCKCDYVEFLEDGEIKKLPVIPSKADMSVDQLAELISKIHNMYEKIIDWDTGELVKKEF